MGASALGQTLFTGKYSAECLESEFIDWPLIGVKCRLASLHVDTLIGKSSVAVCLAGQK